MHRARRFPVFPGSQNTPSLAIETESGLPAYSNAISLTALLPRKVEMSGNAPAKDRSWKGVWCCLEGTSLCIYKDTRSLPSRMRVKSQNSSSSPIRPVSLDPRSLGFAPSYSDLVAAYGPAGGDIKTPLSARPQSLLTPVLPSPMDHRFPASPLGLSDGYLSANDAYLSPFSPGARNSKRFSSVSAVSLLYPPASPAVLEPPASPCLPKKIDRLVTKDNLIRQYSLHGAECGLASDYSKRAHVLRIRVEGEQFLLQLPDLQTNVQWIEVRLFLFLSRLLSLICSCSLSKLPSSFRLILISAQCRPTACTRRQRTDGLMMNAIPTRVHTSQNG